MGKRPCSLCPSFTGRLSHDVNGVSTGRRSIILLLFSSCSTLAVRHFFIRHISFSDVCVRRLPLELFLYTHTHTHTLFPRLRPYTCTGVSQNVYLQRGHRGSCSRNVPVDPSDGLQPDSPSFFSRAAASLQPSSAPCLLIGSARRGDGAGRKLSSHNRLLEVAMVTP